MTKLTRKNLQKLIL